MASSFFHLANSNSTSGATISGVADKNIKCAECLDHLYRASLHSLFVADIHSHADGALSARIDLTSRCISRFLIEICNRNLRALPGENNGDVLADATCGSGDDGNLVLETHANLRCLSPDVRPTSRERPCRGPDLGRP